MNGNIEFLTAMGMKESSENMTEPINNSTKLLLKPVLKLDRLLKLIPSHSNISFKLHALVSKLA